jgi:hypothetical protein
MRPFMWVAAAAATVAITLSAPGTQPAAVAATAGASPLVLAASGCPRVAVPRCPKYYKAACTEYFHRGVYAWRRCCARMGCVASPR